ncbi:MAG TPA: DUF4012 domain-containing protein [Acidimicrobiales bacterium]|nr:DUF4012 domain-containing protein [Acidimicrobiales bacterium]
MGPAVALELVVLCLGAGFAVGAAVARFGPGLVRSRRPLPIRLVALLAAAVASTAGAAATGVRPVDVVLRAAVAGSVVLVGARARPRPVIASALLMAGASLALGGSPLAFVALGFAAAHGSTAHRGRLAAAAISAAVVVAGFELGSAGPVGTATAAALLACAPVVAFGALRMRTEHRRRVTRGLVVLAGVTVVVSAAAGLSAWSTRPQLERGVDQLQAGLSAARAGDGAAAEARLTEAGATFGEADHRLSAWWGRPARAVPVVGQHVAALQAVARVGVGLSATGAETIAGAELDRLRVSAGRVDLAALTSIGKALDRAVPTLHKAGKELDGVRSPWLLPPVAEPLDEQLSRIARTTREARSAAQAVEVLPALLGGEGRRRYFLAVQTPAELRGAGGIIGSYGVISAEGGKVGVEDFGTDGDLNAGGDPATRVLRAPADYLRRHGPNRPERLWQNVTLAPDFPTVAGVAADLFPQSGGAPVDGVLSMDPTALAAVLRIIGPVEVAPWPVPITADNAESVLLFEQYVRLPVEPRKVFLADVAEAVADKFTAADLPPPRALVAALAPAVAGHHLMLTSRQPAEQALFSSIGATGALPTAPDTLAVIGQNAGGNKIDWFLRRRTTYDVRLGDDGLVTATLKVELRNEAPAGGLPDYVIGSSRVPPDPLGVNRHLLSIYSPLAAQHMEVDGGGVAFSSETETGRNVYTVELVLAPGASSVVVVELRGRVGGSGTYRLAVHRQPMVVPEQLRVNVDGEPVARRDAFRRDLRISVPTAK